LFKTFSRFRKLIDERTNLMNKPVMVGNIAPDFSLKDDNGEIVSLEDFAGNNNVVLVFYPKNNTPG